MEVRPARPRSRRRPEGSPPPAAVDAIAREHLAEVDRKLADLAALRHELDEMIGRCRHGAVVAECRIIEALAPPEASLRA